MALLTAEYGDDPDEPVTLGQPGLRAAIADQIASNTPPLVWQTAQRLLAEGRDRVDVMRQLVLALTPSLMNFLVEHRFRDRDRRVAPGPPSQAARPAGDPGPEMPAGHLTSWRLGR